MISLGPHSQLAALVVGILIALTPMSADAHGGRHLERFDRRDAGWLSRWSAANLILWATPRYDSLSNRAEFEVLKVLKGAPKKTRFVAVPESSSRAKALGTHPQLIFLIQHEAAPAHVPFHWSIGRHDHQKEPISIENVEDYIGLQKLMKRGKCTLRLTETLMGLTFQTPIWLSKIALLDAFDLCKSFLPKLSVTGRHYLREAQRRHRSGHKRASPAD